MRMHDGAGETHADIITALFRISLLEPVYTQPYLLLSYSLYDKAWFPLWCNMRLLLLLLLLLLSLSLLLLLLLQQLIQTMNLVFCVISRLK